MLPDRFDLNNAVILCHSCNTPLHLESSKELIRKNYWLGNADRQSRYIFDQQLFMFYDLLQKNNPGLSEYGFLKTLEQFSETRGRVCTIRMFYLLHISKFVLTLYVEGVNKCGNI